MNARYWNDVLHLLGMMILIDGKIYEEEVDAFTDAAISLRDIVDPNLMLTRHMAKDWFAGHRDRIINSIRPSCYESTIARTLKRLDDVDNKKDMIFALLKVAISDGYKHPSEERLLNSACETWGIDFKLAS